jgi:uncharacterized protein involved in exopolysaccharide biosynthesis
MLQSYASEPQTFYGDQEAGLNLAHYAGVVKKRIYYLILPFLIVLLAGIVFTAIQRSIYLAQGKILVESQEIPADLVRPTVTSAASERIQVIQQRIMTRENLLAIMNKYGLFTKEQKWMSGSQLLDLMRDRTAITLIEATGTTPGRRDVNTIAFTLGFEYESAELAMRVANEFMTLILNEDARTRTNRAVETTRFLAREVERLQRELGQSEAQITDAKQRKLESSRQQQQSGIPASGTVSTPLNQTLANLKADLAEKEVVYSGTHPTIKMLKQKIAALEKSIAASPPAPQTVSASTAVDDVDRFGLDALQKQKATIEKSLDEASKKLTAGRLGESLERDQQSERLEVIEQPTLPQKPIKPNRIKLLVLTFAAAMAAGIGALFAVETVDRTIRGSHELLGIFDSHLVVAIPYISTRKETLRKKKKKVYIIGGIVAVLTGGGALAVFLDLIPVDLMSWIDIPTWIEMLRGIAK